MIFLSIKTRLCLFTPGFEVLSAQYSVIRFETLVTTKAPKISMTRNTEFKVWL